ncbi:MAG: Mut7-C RNAse domain-containing protein [Candidatus Magnetoovum sp. WYHC-5]|nr:Mut7-C RNAse domain-containing protein [Candidatus Magnetoovum sp. WYHC-5]
MSFDMKFAADAMLGRLTRWLRILGYDTFYERDINDSHLVRI